jgi:competence protein ComEA
MWGRLQRQAQNAFGFSPVEANGFLALLGLLAVLVVGPLAVQSFWPRPAPPPHPADVALLNQTAAAIELEQPSSLAEAPPDGRPDSRDFSPGPDVAALRPFPFDPNQATEEQWKKLGLKPWLAQRIVKYRSRGGKFRIKTDLKKIYGFPEPAYDRLQAYIQLPESLEKGWLNGQDQAVANPKARPEPAADQAAVAPVPVRPALAKFDLNQADTAQLRAVRGIGPVLAERIVKFRRGLGGFHHLDQLQEVYGLPPEARQALLAAATLPATPAVNPLAINQADVNTLKVHPYLGYKLAQVIVNYRQQHGPFATPDDLLKTQVIDAEKLAKLRPYLKF